MTTNPLASLLAKVQPVAPAAPAPVTVPATLDFTRLGITLFGFQEEGVRYILDQHAKGMGAYVADQMGLGKTPMGIAAVALSGSIPALVVVPPALTANWRIELRKVAPWLRVEVLSGTKPTMPAPADVYVIGSAVLPKWAGLRKVTKPGERDRFVVEGVLTTMGLRALVVDEAHHYKTGKAQRTRSLVLLSKMLPASTLRVLMSGTPIVNRHAELPSQIEALGVESVFGGIGRFWGRFAPKIDSWGTRGSAHGEELHALMTGPQGFMIRRLRSEVLDLPNKGRQTVAAEMTGRAAVAYKAATEDLIAYLRNERGHDAAERAGKAEALVLLNTLRRLAGEAKIASVIAYVEELLSEEGEQVFVTTEHTPVAEAIAAHFHAPRIVGGMSAEHKQAAVEAFQNGSAKVIVGNTRAAGVGFTLTSGRHIVVAEMPWTPGDLMQVEDRLHRIGQTREVFSHCALAVNGARTIDERLFAILNDKAGVVGTAIDGTPEVLFDDESITEAVLDTYREEAV